MLNPFLEAGARVLGPDGPEMVRTIQRIAQKQGIPTEQIVKDALAFMKEMEVLSDRSGKTVKQVADEALADYRRKVG